VPSSVDRSLTTRANKNVRRNDTSTRNRARSRARRNRPPSGQDLTWLVRKCTSSWYVVHAPLWPTFLPRSEPSAVAILPHASKSSCVCARLFMTSLAHETTKTTLEHTRNTHERMHARKHACRRKASERNTHVHEAVQGLLLGGQELSEVGRQRRLRRVPPEGGNDLGDAERLRVRSDRLDVTAVAGKAVGGVLCLFVCRGEGTDRTLARGTERAQRGYKR